MIEENAEEHRWQRPLVQVHYKTLIPTCHGRCASAVSAAIDVVQVPQVSQVLEWRHKLMRHVCLKWPGDPHAIRRKPPPCQSTPRTLPRDGLSCFFTQG